MVRREHVRVLFVLAALVLTLAGRTPVHAGQILPGQGLDLFQLDLTFRGAEMPDSRYGLAVVDFNRLASRTGLSLGYLNIVTNTAGWAVRNIPFDLSSGYPGMSTMFDLGRSGNVSSLGVFAFVTPVPQVTFSGVPSTVFSVGALPHNAQGSDRLRPSPPGVSVDASVLNFQSGGPTVLRWQPDHVGANGLTNIEQDANQCGPASVANSLEWLHDTRALPVPHVHSSGVRDGTLVGQLDLAMNRPAGDVVSSAKDFLEGKLKYIDENGLSPLLRIEHKNNEVFPPLGGDVTVGNTTSKVDTSSLSLFEWILAELEAGEDVEIRIGWDGGGGHFVDLTGGGFILGVPFLSFIHDADQGNPGGRRLADGGIGWSPVVDNKIVAYIGGSFASGTISYAVSQSISFRVPEPSTLMLLGVGVLSFVGYSYWKRQHVRESA